MYDLGRGVPRDRVRAHMWMSLAASRATVKGQYAEETSDPRGEDVRRTDRGGTANGPRVETEADGVSGSGNDRNAAGCAVSPRDQLSFLAAIPPRGSAKQSDEDRDLISFRSTAFSSTPHEKTPFSFN